MFLFRCDVATLLSFSLPLPHIPLLIFSLVSPSFLSPLSFLSSYLHFIHLFFIATFLPPRLLFFQFPSRPWHLFSLTSTNSCEILFSFEPGASSQLEGEMIAKCSLLLFFLCVHWSYSFPFYITFLTIIRYSSIFFHVFLIFSLLSLNPRDNIFPGTNDFHAWWYSTFPLKPFKLGHCSREALIWVLP